jgi:hypothetical protein
MKIVPSQMPRKMPTFTSRPVEPVTTMFATRESMISCTLGSAGRKFFRMLSIWWSLAGSVPKRPSKCQRKSRPGARVKRN